MISEVARTRVSESYPDIHPVVATATVLGFTSPEALVRTAARHREVCDEIAAPYVTEFADASAIRKDASTPFFVIPFIEHAFNPGSSGAVPLDKNPVRKRHAAR